MTCLSGFGCVLHKGFIIRSARLLSPELTNVLVHSVAMMELTCPLDSVHHLESARNRKQLKVEYLQLLAEVDIEYLQFISQ